MLNKEKLLQFLLKARTETYAGGKGKVQPLFNGSNQLEYKEGDWLYRDVFIQEKEFLWDWKLFITKINLFGRCLIMEPVKKIERKYTTG